jgi:ZIP family zinc transporter
MLGFAAGVMIAASFWSLLAPAIEISQEQNIPGWLPVSVGFLLGTIFLRIIDSILPHLHIGFPIKEAEGVKSTWSKSILLVTAITLHNIPEGLAIGVSFGATGLKFAQSSVHSAIALTLGMAIHNIPEGISVAFPLRRDGVSRIKSVMFGQLSAIVEPIFAVIGAWAILWVKVLLPYAMAFAAGAMIFVVVEEVIPESQRNGNTHIATTGSILGFLIMMIISVILG